ncbi:Fic family protein [uncultured Bacteroides sp.]|uniref:Fic family protein n=1 Tax=uncultured Bacteroides sp. TaxID=162156 RepID=UPI0025B3528A|nr:Fic family protein [uncultured Bacteroides sp.]MCX4337971.1 Fic family protein [Bacteroidales bacterium]
MIDFDTYIRMGEPGGKERAEAWKTAIGLQAVDGLKTSEYLNETAAKHIEGDITIDQVKELIDTYYQSKTNRTPEEDEIEEADKASANIARILNEPSFTFSIHGLTSIHKRIFTGIFKHAGILRDYEISKKEWVLDGASVSYGFAYELQGALAHDIQRERDFNYTGMDMSEIVKHIAQLTSDIWQIHPFCEGNTRTTAVFIIKYLRSLGFDVNNSIFEKNSWYFRNALVRANYQNLQKGIYKDIIHLERFFRNLMMGEDNVLMNRYLHIKAQGLINGVAPTSTPTSTPTSLIPENANIKRLIEVIGENRLSVKEMLIAIGLKDRPNFLEYTLSPAMNEGYVRMLYPASPRHPRQKYLLTVKGLAAYKEIKERQAESQ